MSDPSLEEKQFVIGCVLGDGCLRIQSGRNLATLNLFQSTSQLAYLRWKTAKLDKLFTAEIRPKWSGVERRIKGYQITSRGHAFLTWLKEEMYITRGWKRITERTASYISLPAIAVWFLDDGSLYKRQNRHGSVYNCLSLGTYDFQLESCEMARDLIEHHTGARFYIYKSARLGRWHMRIQKQSAVSQFLDAITPYCPDCMQNKIGRLS